MCVCVFEAVNPCLDDNNGGCHADGECVHTGPNKVEGKYKQTFQIASKHIRYNFISEYGTSAGFMKVNLIGVSIYTKCK